MLRPVCFRLGVYNPPEPPLSERMRAFADLSGEFFQRRQAYTLPVLDHKKTQTANVPMKALRRFDSFHVLPRWFPL